MKTLKHLVCTMVLMTGCAHAAPPSSGLVTPSNQSQTDSHETSGTLLDGISINGQVRAQGLIGLFSVPGILMFSDGQLIWIVEGDADAGVYASWSNDGNIEFWAEHRIDNGESVVWSGRYKGSEFQDVTAVWNRTEGDFVHDLLLPDRVILHFTPDA